MLCRVCGKLIDLCDLQNVLDHEHNDAGITTSAVGAQSGRVYTLEESSIVAAITYRKDSETLDVEYKNGAVYRYFDIPEAVFTKALGSTAIGAFLSNELKGAYRYARVLDAINCNNP